MNITPETDLSELFPKRFLNAASLEGQVRKYRITDITREMVGQPPKMETILALQDAKGTATEMILNVTNADRLAMLFKTRKVASWRGRVIALHTEMTSFGGKTTPGLRVAMNGTPTAAPQPAPKMQPAGKGEAYEEDLNDDDEELKNDIPQ